MTAVERWFSTRSTRALAGVSVRRSQSDSRRWALRSTWALLALAPRWGVTRRLVHSFVYPVIYGVIYLAFLVTSIFFTESPDVAGMGDLNGVLALFSRPIGVLTGWTHYLVFDLFVGAWIARDAIAAESMPNIETAVLQDVDLELLRRNRIQGTVRPFTDRRLDLYGVRVTNPDGTVTEH